VILAAPLQQCQISFLQQGHLDDASLLPLTFNGLLKGEESHQPPRLPSSATRRYRQTVTTVISNASLQEDNFNSTFRFPPKSVYMTEEGERKEKISSITQLTDDGLYKLFSSEVLSDETLQRAFGQDYKLVAVKVWGGPHGGAYPSFEGGGEASVSPPFLLYDGGKGSMGSALFYINGIEAAVASIEISAIGAKSVAKLVSKRLGLTPKKQVDIELEFDAEPEVEVEQEL